MEDLTRFEFVEDEGFRFKINPRKANSMSLQKVLLTLKDNGYVFLRLFEGGCIYAYKN